MSLVPNSRLPFHCAGGYQPARAGHDWFTQRAGLHGLAHQPLVFQPGPVQPDVGYEYFRLPTLLRVAEDVGRVNDPILAEFANDANLIHPPERLIADYRDHLLALAFDVNGSKFLTTQLPRLLFLPHATVPDSVAVRNELQSYLSSCCVARHANDVVISLIRHGVDDVKDSVVDQLCSYAQALARDPKVANFLQSLSPGDGGGEQGGAAPRF